MCGMIRKEGNNANKERVMRKGHRKDYTGLKIGKLTVYKKGTEPDTWVCKCEC